MRRLPHFICPARYGLCIFCDFHRLFMIFLLKKTETWEDVYKRQVGYGLAEKRQVMDMTRRLLKLKAVPRPDDAADALAIAICHARSATSLLRRKDPDVKETV